MLETILDRHIIFVLLGILAFVGIMSKCIVNISLKRLVRAAGNMNKSTHPLMRLVRAKFEHASMVSDKVENVRVFVDKYLYEYRVLGIRLHGWQRLEKMTAGLCLLAGAAGAGLAYGLNGMDYMVWRIGATGAGLALVVYLAHLVTDEKYQLEAIRNYMVDYLENVCLHKYEKSNHKEIKVLAQEGISAEFGVMPAENIYDAGRENINRGTDMGMENQSQGVGAGERNLSRGTHIDEGNPYDSAEFVDEEDLFQDAGAIGSEVSGAFQTADPDRGDAVNAFRMAEPISEEAMSAFRPVDTVRAGNGAEGRRESRTEARPERRAESRTDRRSEVRAEAAAVLQAAEYIREEGNSWQRDARIANPAIDPGMQQMAAKSAGTIDMGIDLDLQQTSAKSMRAADSAIDLGIQAPRQSSVELELEHPSSRETVRENIVEIPVPEFVPEPAEEVKIEVPEPSKVSVKAASARQVTTKERGMRRERSESEADRDIVIRRILEEFMA